MQKFSLILLALGFVFSACEQKPQAEGGPVAPEHPNVLFILVDDLGYTDLSCMGSDYYQTPNVDRIAQAGMVFEQGYATCQVCSPSRASLMTGQFPARHDITNYIGARVGANWRELGRHTKLLPPEYTRNLPAEVTTLPEALHSAGYRTFFAGKWHLGDEGSWPEDHGFEFNAGGWSAGSPNGGFFDPFNNPRLPNRQPGENRSMRLARETADFISQHRDTNFFAMLSFYAVHSPVQTTQEKWQRYRTKAEQMGIADDGFVMERRLPARQHQDNPVYAGLIEHMDEAVGLVLDRLDSLGLAENTLVVFTSDNGGVVSGDAFSTNLAPLRGGKGYQWEGGIRVPFFVQVPWLKHGGKKTATPVTGADIYPTLLDLLGLPAQPEAHRDGMSFKPLLTGGELPDRPLFWHYPHYGNQGGDPVSIIREGDWKLIHYWEGDNKELYNLAEDLGEQNDLAAAHPERVASLDAKLLAYLSEVGAQFAETDPAYNAQAAAERQRGIVNNLLPRLERQRREMLSPGWQPNEDWWGSQVTVD